MAFSEEDKEWLKQVIEASDGRMRQYAQTLNAELEEKMSQKIEKVETNLLTAFHEARDRARA